VQTRSSNLSEILLAKGLVGADELLAAEREQRVAHRPLGRVLLDRHAITETQLMSALAEQMSLEFVDLRDQPVDAMVASLVPDAIARSHGIIPIGLDEHGRLRLAMSDPTNVVAIDDVRTITDRAVVPVVATHEDVLAAIDQVQGAGTSVEQVAGDLDVGDDTTAEVGQVVEADEAPIVRFVNAIIQQAVGARASDIHIEPGEREVGVRFRIR